jgi:hypothetical protein
MSSKNINLQWRDQNPSSSSPCHDRQGPPLPAMASKASPPCRALPPLPAATSSMVAQIDAELGDARGCRDRGCRTMKLPDGGGAVTGSSDGGGATAVHRDLQHAEADGGEERDVITSAVQARASLAEVRLRRGEADGGEECCSVTTATMGSSSLSLSCFEYRPTGRKGACESFWSPSKLLHFCIAEEVEPQNESAYRASIGEYLYHLQCLFNTHFGI